MCLISVVPKGVNKDIEQIKGFIVNGMSSNSDGSGFAYKRNGKSCVNIHKGFRQEADMVSEIKKLNLGVDDELIIHHRIGTSGEKNVANMHPFVISDIESVIIQDKGSFNLPIMAHNGVFNKYTDNNSKYSDTYHFIEKFMSTPEIMTLLKRDKSKFKELFESTLTYNKLAILSPDRDLIMIGNFTQEDGCYHSNGGYKSYVYDRGGSSSCSVQSRQLPINNLFEDESSTQLTRRRTCYKFNGDQIKITKENSKHFILVPKSDLPVSSGGCLDRVKAYVFDDYDENCTLNFITEYAGERQTHYLTWDRLSSEFDLFVKNEYNLLYCNLYKFAEDYKNGLTKSMSKKISKLLDKSKAKNHIVLKNYGNIRKDVFDSYIGKILEVEKENNDLKTELICTNDCI